MSIHAINSFHTAGLGGTNNYLASLFGAGRGRGLAALAGLAGQGFTSVGRSTPAAGSISGFSPTFPGRQSESPGPFISAAFQRTRDGDQAFFGSRASALTSVEREAIRELAARDQEVRIHELAHLATAGPLAKGGATYDFTTGPDGKRYAVGGSVQIDTTPGRTPQETLAKAQQMRSAALAPSEPSGADRAVAAQAARLSAQAQRELQAQPAADAPLQPTNTEPIGPTGGSAPIDPTAVTPSTPPRAGNEPPIDATNPLSAFFDLIPGLFESFGDGEVKYQSADGRVKLKFESEDGNTEFKLRIRGEDGTFKLKFENEDGAIELKMSFKPTKEQDDHHHHDDDDHHAKIDDDDHGQDQLVVATQPIAADPPPVPSLGAAKIQPDGLFNPDAVLTGFGVDVAA